METIIAVILTLVGVWGLNLVKDKKNTEFRLVGYVIIFCAVATLAARAIWEISL